MDIESSQRLLVACRHRMPQSSRKVAGILVTVVAATVLGGYLVTNGPSKVQFEKAYQLAPGEGVFAYSRISPDGRLLAYASERQRFDTVVRIAKVVDLLTDSVLFSEPGIDAYFSPDGDRMIYLSMLDSGHKAVSIWSVDTGRIVRDVAPSDLGDYYSWGRHAGNDLILTILGHYYYLDGNAAVLPHRSVLACPGIGTGERPLISRDGRRITTFVRGEVVVRGIDNCDNTIHTGIRGAKADFSFDGRYIALHVPRERGVGYEIVVVDLVERSMRRVTEALPGSSLFPNWTRDGRLSFRYDDPEFHGFMFASNVLAARAEPIIDIDRPVVRVGTEWSDVFPETPLPDQAITLVLVWAPWSAHSPQALADFQSAVVQFRRRRVELAAVVAPDPVSRDEDIRAMLLQTRVNLPRIDLSFERLSATDMQNQSPSTLLFLNGRLRDRKLGAQSPADLEKWVTALLAK